VSEESIATKTVIHRVPGMDDVRVRADLAYRGALGFDLYAPARADAPLPAVVLVAGYPDPGFKMVLGCRFKEMGSTVSWARLIAASGMVAIPYTNEDPVADLHALLRHLRQNASALGLDARRIGAWASSGHVTLALSLALRDSPEKPACAALLYGYTLDLDGARGVADASARFGFANPCAGRGVDDLASDVPLLLVRAGRDEMPGLNDALDRFAARALAADLPVSLVNHPTGVHAFELAAASAAARAAVEQTLAFLRSHLYAGDTTVNRG
jgi:dienelactone hydrolase